VVTFCLIHGNWHDSSSWDRLVPELRARGHDTAAPDLSIDDPASTYEERVRPALEMLEGVTGPIAVVGHSASSGYAAMVASRAPASLLVHLCPRLEQFQPTDAPRVFRETLRFPPRRSDGAIVWDRDDAIEQMYPRLEPETAGAFAEKLRPSAPPADEFPLDGHPDVETVVVYASEDEFFEPEWERFIAGEIGAEAIEIGGGHFPMAEDPHGLAELLDRLARERAS
jgi:pimeloyl-ACP methyl ester carboxylesterase